MVDQFHRTWVGRLRQDSGIIFLLALGVRLALVFVTRTYLSIEHTEVVNIATSLATQGSFADAYGHTGPTAHASPLYPALLSLIFRVFGTGLSGEIAQEIFSSTIASMIYAFLPILSVISDLGADTGTLAGILGAILPVNFWSETKGSFEAPAVGLLLLIFCIAISRVWRSASFSIQAAISTGLISGVALLLSPVLAPVIVATLFFGCVLFRQIKIKECIRFSAIVLGIVILCLTPWTIRNYLVLGGPVWSRSNLGLELFVANSDLAAPNMNDNYKSHWFDQSHPFASPTERTKLLAMGELPYQHAKLASAERWITTHPGHFAWLTAQRIYYFWFPRMVRPIQSVLMGGFTVGALIGLIQLLRGGKIIAWMLLGILVSYPFIYYFVAAFPRYRSPIDWLLIFLTSFCICSSKYFSNLKCGLFNFHE